MRAAASLNIPVVAVYQTDVAGFALRYGLTAASNVAWRRIRSIHERAHITLAPSPTAARDLQQHGIPRVQVWPRGVDTAAFSPAHRDVALHARLAAAGEVLVGFGGRLAAEKQVEDLAVLCDLPGIRLVVIGDGPEALATAPFAHVPVKLGSWRDRCCRLSPSVPAGFIWVTLPAGLLGGPRS